MIREIENLPDVSFIDNKTLSDIRSEMIADFQEKYEEIEGKKKTLARADPITLLLYAAAVQIYQGFLYIDKIGKMDLLKYSYGEYLENGPAALRGLTRETAEPAVVTVRFTLSAVQADAIGIPIGTQVTNGELFFVSTEYAEIPIGDTYIDIDMVCLTDGEVGNGIAVGELSELVDPIPYIESVSNITETAGGTDTESDESLRDRIFLSPSGFSTAGSKAAYVYWAKEYSNDIEDVVVDSPSVCLVKVYFTTKGGVIPTTTQINGLQAWLEDEEIKPLTDEVVVLAPTSTTFNITMTYYIAKSNASKATTIQEAVAAAVEEYVLWQQGAIGRDINPDKLINLVIAAGAKRVSLTYPAFAVVSKTTLPQLGTKTVTYGGLEDD